MRFSRRTSWDTSESSLAQAIREQCEAGHTLIDLTVSNPTLCGFHFDSAAVLGALQSHAAMTYHPDPRGIPAAREAIARYYLDHGAAVDPGNLILTTSTSEAYSFLFRLLADPGDSILVARPSYPLFDFLADLDNVRLDPYPLFFDFGWWIDLSEMERSICPGTRAILVVHPNNPTGHATSRGERERLEALCVRHGLALIVDEVFLDFGIDAEVETFAQGPHPCLTFVLSGISKVAALPQMKCAWIAAFGPEPDRRAALDRLEVVADTFLSMNAPTQHALAAWLQGRKGIQKQLLERVRRNLGALSASGLDWLPVEAGWSAVIRLPRQKAVKNASELLVRDAKIVVHAGDFYGFADPGVVVLSLIGPLESFAEGIQRLKRWSEPDELTPVVRQSSSA